MFYEHTIEFNFKEQFQKHLCMLSVIVLRKKENRNWQVRPLKNWKLDSAKKKKEISSTMLGLVFLLHLNLFTASVCSPWFK